MKRLPNSQISTWWLILLLISLAVVEEGVLRPLMRFASAEEIPLQSHPPLPWAQTAPSSQRDLWLMRLHARWRRRSRFRSDFQPQIQVLPNQTTVVETCSGAPMFSLCDQGCRETVQRWHHLTGETCHRPPNCSQQLRCDGIECKCCEKLICPIQRHKLSMRTGRNSGELLIKNCTLINFDTVCGTTCQMAPQVNGDLRRYLNQSCHHRTCQRIQNCQGIACQCCDLHTCVTQPNYTTDQWQYDNLPDEDQHLLALNHEHSSARLGALWNRMSNLSISLNEDEWTHRRRKKQEEEKEWLDSSATVVPRSKGRSLWNPQIEGRSWKNHQMFPKEIPPLNHSSTCRTFVNALLPIVFTWTRQLRSEL